MNGTETNAEAGPYSYTSPMTATLIGYTRCSTDRQALAAVRQGDTLIVPKLDRLATFAEFEADLIRMCTREGMASARDKGKLRGKQPKLSDRQQRELCRMHVTGEYSISDLAELFSVSRPTV